MIRRGMAWVAAALAIAPAAARGQATDRGAFVLRVGADTQAVERFTRTPTTVDAELGIKGRARIVYQLRTAPDGTVTGVEMRAWAGMSDTVPPLQHITVSWEGDSARTTIEGSGQHLAQTVRGARGAIPIVNPSALLLEQVLMRARATPGDSASVPVFVVGTTQAVPARVRRTGADSAVITVGAVEVRARTDAAGRLLGAAIPSQHLLIERVANAGSLGMPRPDYSAPAGALYTAQEVRVPHPGGFRLAGTLTLPKERAGRVPAVVTITGSGQEDRDEAIPIVRGYRPFRQVADTLGRRGIAVLRMDDRGFGESEGDASRATSADFATDIAVVGHSEGGIIAPIVAAADPRLRAVVLVAGTSRTGRRILEYQLRSPLDADTSLTPARRDSAYAQGWVLVDSMATVVPWMKWFLEYDPLPTARRVRQPVLILQGATDRQVTADQAPELAAALRAGGNRDVTVRVFPGLNHLMVPDPGGMPSGYATLPSGSVDAQVLGALADWLAQKLGR